MEHKTTFQLIFLGAALILVLLEWFISRKRHLTNFDVKETLTSIGILVGMIVAKALLLGFEFWALGLGSGFAVYPFPRNFGVFIVCFLTVDFVYYWYHRFSHEWKWLWSFHMVHHSATKMNLSTSFRLNWFAPLVTIWFFVPLSALGFPPEMILACLALNLLFQFFLHTEVVGKIPLLEGIVNTPSAHRVHHGKNKAYLDKNYGGLLMVWDMAFDTYEEEKEQVVYGTTEGFNPNRPCRLVVGSLSLGMKNAFLKKQS